MSRTPYPFYVDDVSALSRSLTRQLSELGHTPGHVEMLNLLARAAGFRNYQGWQASHSARQHLAEGALPAAVDYTRIRRLCRYFDGQGRLLRWPGKYSDRAPCLWVLWSRLPHHHTLHEREVNGAIQAAEALGDHVLLRRALVDQGLLERTADGREYRRVERRPPPEAAALIRQVLERGAQAGSGSAEITCPR